MDGKMKAGTIFRKTIAFAWLKLGLSLLKFLINLVLLGILLGIGFLISESAIVVMLIIWGILAGIVRFIFGHYLMYMAKAGHIAVITAAVTGEEIPDKPIQYGKDMVLSRFAASNVFFAIDKLVSAAVRQLQNLVDRIGSLLKVIPGMSFVTSFTKIFLSVTLGYVDECCLGYTFYKKEEGAFKSACDGVVIYAQNIKLLLKSGLGTALVVLLLQLVTMAVPFFGFWALLMAFGVLDVFAIIAAVVLAIMFSEIIRFAFIDSWVLTRTMVTYMSVAPSTVITYDLYQKLCGLSRSFRKLFNKGREEDPQISQPSYAYNTTYIAPVPQPAYAGGGQPEAYAPPSYAAPPPAQQPQQYTAPAAEPQPQYQAPPQPPQQPQYQQQQYQPPQYSAPAQQYTPSFSGGGFMQQIASAARDAFSSPPAQQPPAPQQYAAPQPQAPVPQAPESQQYAAPQPQAPAPQPQAPAPQAPVPQQYAAPQSQKPAPAPKPTFCSQCGEQFSSPGQNFCNNCGFNNN